MIGIHSDGHSKNSYLFVYKTFMFWYFSKWLMIYDIYHPPASLPMVSPYQSLAPIWSLFESYRGHVVSCDRIIA